MWKHNGYCGIACLKADLPKIIEPICFHPHGTDCAAWYRIYGTGNKFDVQEGGSASPRNEVLRKLPDQLIPVLLAASNR